MIRSRSSLFTKMLFLILVLGLTAGIISGLGIHSMSLLHQQVRDTVDISAQGVYLGSQMRRSLLTATRAEAWFILANTQAERAAYEAAIEREEQNMERRAADLEAIEHAEERELLRTVMDAWHAWSESHDRVEELTHRGQTALAFEEAAGPGRRAAEAAERTLTELVDRTDRKMNASVEEAEGAYTRTRAAVVSISACGVILSVLLAALIARRITSNARSLVETAERITRTGDLSHPIEVRGADEIGQLGETLEQMRQSLGQSREALERAHVELEDRVEERTAELKKRNAELDQFAYVASHDLRAPLRAITNLATWIEEDAGDRLPTETYGHLEKLKGRVERMDRLLDDLLTYSRAGRFRAPPERVDSRELVDDIAEMIYTHEGFTIQVDEELPELVIDRPAFELVLRNLIGNAVKHHDREDGRVEVSGRRCDGGTFEFSVRDDGPGIPPEYHERVFQMFQTLRPRDEVEGSGIGLALVQKTVEAYGGEVSLESAEGQGTTIRFTWPEMEEAYEHEGQQDGSSAPGRG